MFLIGFKNQTQVYIFVGLWGYGLSLGIKVT